MVRWDRLVMDSKIPVRLRYPEMTLSERGPSSCLIFPTCDVCLHAWLLSLHIFELVSRDFNVWTVLMECISLWDIRKLRQNWWCSSSYVWQRMWWLFKLCLPSGDEISSKPSRRTWKRSSASCWLPCSRTSASTDAWWESPYLGFSLCWRHLGIGMQLPDCWGSKCRNWSLLLPLWGRDLLWPGKLVLIRETERTRLTVLTLMLWFCWCKWLEWMRASSVLLECLLARGVYSLAKCRCGCGRNR